LSQIVLAHAPRQVSVSLILGVRQNQTMKTSIQCLIFAVCMCSTASAAPETIFFGEIASIEYYTVDPAQGTGFTRDANQKIEAKLYDHWVFITVSWRSGDGARQSAEYIIPREKILRIVINESSVRG